MKAIINNLKHYWWVIFIIFGLPLFLNFFVFQPSSQLSAGRLQDWISFWGNYLGATISTLTAFVILFIQRKDHEREVVLNRLESQRENGRNKLFAHRENARLENNNTLENRMNRQLQLRILSHHQETQWLGDLREALVNYISAYRENEIKDVINSIQESSLESIQQKIRVLYNTLAKTDTALSLVISENSNTAVGDTYQKELARLYTQYKSIIDDIQLLACLYYNKEPISNEASDNLNNLIVTMEIDSEKIDYNQFSELAHQIIKPLPCIFEAVRTISQSCIKEERQRIDSILDGSIENP